MADTGREILDGIRLLDLTQKPAGAYCTMLLADHGAEVIRIESEENAARNSNLDRGKKSVALDLHSDEGKAGLRTLVATADILVEDFPTGTMDRLGLSYDSLSEINPALVYTANTEAVSTDAQAVGGVIAFGIMAALREAEATGRGQLVNFAKQPRKNETDGGNPINFSAAPTPVLKSPPQFGEHTENYLSEMPPSRLSDTEKRAMRDAFGCFATGVTIVTTRQADGTPRGFTANSFTSVSLDPPLLLVCIAKQAYSCDVFTSAAHFAVSVLREDQKALSGLFASPSNDKFSEATWHPGVADMPVFDDSLASFVCSREKAIDAGDHVILVGRVVDQASNPGQPLGYLRGNYFSVGLDQGLVDAALDGAKVEIGALIEDQGRLLLAMTTDGGFEVPKAPSDTPSINALAARFRGAGLTVEPDFLYAIYRNSSTGLHTIIYHGSADGAPPQGHRFIAVDDLPFSRIRSAPERSMLERFAHESKHGSFGIYYGDETSGTVHRVTSREPSKF